MTLPVARRVRPRSNRCLGILIPLAAVARGMTIARLGTQPKRPALAGAIGGTEIATFDEAIFLRPDGTADTHEIRLIEGVVVPRSARR